MDSQTIESWLDKVCASSSETLALLAHGSAFRTINYRVSREIRLFLANLKHGLCEVNTSAFEKETLQRAFQTSSNTTTVFQSLWYQIKMLKIIYSYLFQTVVIKIKKTAMHCNCIVGYNR